ncbi:hypothetical protein [Streptoalloteichus hindustanus]|uniref:Uncharacterized protein n=1 Tax=Streptoalloteichus hindustanus TaxID=2017 RepID=A0A1M5JAK4_STRHI|nr:hypothetical protein [Streptoalloteichus hindustanus]SHG37521.1 hypothetical protein SAMN05444320_108199 [Streptoalloteichus hindustanus]
MSVQPTRTAHDLWETNPMLMHEAMARTRMREAQRWAGQQRLARRLASVHRWEWLARFAARRAGRAATAVVLG